jgi:glucokinase
MRRYAGVDIGATNTRVVVGDAASRMQATARGPTPSGPTGTDVSSGVMEIFQSACDSAGLSPTQLDAVGIGSIGPLDLTTGAIKDPANLAPTVESVPLVEPISALIESDAVYLHNDAVAGVIGERFYADYSPQNMLYLTLSTGIGAGVCVDGQVLAGWDGNAAEVGHITLERSSEQTCGCGRNGHWEAYCSGSNIPRYARYLHETTDVETRLPIDESSFSAATLFAAAEEDPLADTVIDRLAAWNTSGFATLVHAYAPMVIYVGGAVALNNPELVLDPVRERLPDQVITNIPEIRLTTLGGDVVVRGALASAMTGGTGDRTRLDY